MYKLDYPNHHSNKPPLWASLYWPMLPFVAFDTECAEKVSPKQPVARVICEQIHQKRRIAYANRPAQKIGISAGMSLGSANSLCPTLQSRLRSTELEKAQLEKIAKTLESTAPYIEIDTENFCTHLEISTCLKLHNGITGFQQHLKECLGTQLETAQLALGPTIECATIFAQRHPGDTSFWTRPAQFWRKWHALPIDSLRIDLPIQHALSDCGFTQLADILQLGHPKNPKQTCNYPSDPDQPPSLTSQQLAALKRRFGPNFINYWHKLCGQQLSLRHMHLPPKQFEQILSLPYEAKQLQALLPAIQSLLNRLEHFLIQHCASILCFNIALKNTQNKSTVITIQLTQPHHRAAFFYELAQLQLQQQTLSAPVIEIRVSATQCITQQNTPLDLFDAKHSDTAMNTLLCRLQARLGVKHISHMSTQEDYRPEFFLAKDTISSTAPLTAPLKTKPHPRKTYHKKNKKLTSSKPLSKAFENFAPNFSQQPTWLIQPLAITDVGATPKNIPPSSSTSENTQSAYKRTLKLNPPPRSIPHTAAQTQLGLASVSTLELLQGPHFMHTGWWDQDPVYRAYYIARSSKHSLYWVFQNLETQQWFLQGFFS